MAKDPHVSPALALTSGPVPALGTATTPMPAGASAPTFAPSLPLVLVHGMGSRDERLRTSHAWRQTPDELRILGFDVWFGCQDSFGSVEGNAAQLARSLERILEITGASKLNLVAHSKGGLDARAALHDPALAGHIASLTTLATPHRGLRFCDALARSRCVIPRVVAPAVDARARHAGDAQPASLSLLHNLTTAGARMLSKGCPDLPQVAYRSLAFMPSPPPRTPVHAAVAHCDGESDGLVPLWSTEHSDWIVVRAQAAAGAPAFQHDDAVGFPEGRAVLKVGGLSFPRVSTLIAHVLEEMEHAGDLFVQ